MWDLIVLVFMFCEMGYISMQTPIDFYFFHYITIIIITKLL